MSQRNRDNSRNQRGPSQRERPSTSESHNASQSRQNELSEAEKKMYVVAASKYILAMTKKKLPIKCADVVKNCLQGNSKLFAPIFEEVSRILADTYGLVTHEIRDQSTAKIILCTSSVTSGSEHELTPEQRDDFRLLYIVLSYIHMKNDAVGETTLHAFLKRLGLDDEPHAEFGDFKKKISETFVRQMYLKREKVVIEGGNADDKIRYTWGRRAHLEVPKEIVTENVAKIFGRAVEGHEAENDDGSQNGDALETSDIEMNDY